MQPHEQRVVDERDDLIAKMRKLSDFMAGQVFSKLPYEDRKLLEIQYSTMVAYRDVLSTRIGRFT